MLEVTVNINREQIVAQLHAVRTKPKTKNVKEGTMCTYNIVYNNTVVGSMTGKYGCGVDLAIALLEHWKEDGHIYRMVSVMKTIEEIENENKRS